MPAGQRVVTARAQHHFVARFMATVLAALGTFSGLEAQAVGTVRGVTVDAMTNEPLGDVSIVVRGTEIGATSGATGVFLLPGVPVGAQTLVVSRIGYAAEERKVDVIAGDTLRLRFALRSSPVNLDELAVTAEAEATQIRESPFSVTVIDGQRLAGRGLTLDEALQRVTGVQIRRSGGLGSASIFNIRGLEGQRVQIYIDGNAADVAGDAFSLDDIPLQLVERIEVYKGVVPARFGGDGLGAAVNVVTIHPEGGYLDVGYAAGSYGQHQLSATVKRRLGSGFEGSLSVNLDRAENDYVMESPYLTDIRIRRDHDQFERLVAGGSLTTDRLWFDELEMEAAYIATRRELQGIQTNVQHAQTHSGFGVVVLDGEATGRLGGRLDLRIGGAFASTRSGLTDTSSVRYTFDGTSYPSPNGRGELGVLPSDSDNRTTLFRHRTTATYRFAPEHIANLTYVLDWSRYRPSDPVANHYSGRNVSEFPGDQSSAVVGLSHEWRPAGDRFVNVFGVRGYAFRSKGTPSNLNDPAAERPPEVRNSTVTAGASEAVRYRLTPTLLAKGSVEWARRLPTSSELFGDGLLVTAAPALRPERSLNFNIGLQYDRTFDDGRRVQAQVNGFWMNLRDMIRLAQGFAGLAAYTNQGAARIRGAEAEIRADVTRWLHGAARPRQLLVDFDVREAEVIYLTVGLLAPERFE